MGFFKFIRSKEGSRHLLRLLLVWGGLIFFIWVLLWWYTGHGDYISVPDLRGKTLEEARVTLEERDLSFLVVDSIFRDEAQGGTIWDQSPGAEEQVKEGRQVFLSVYAEVPPQEKININQGEYAQVALIKLKNKGIRYKTKMESNNNLIGSVIRVTYKGKTLRPEDHIARGEEVTVYIGEAADARVSIPNVLGMSLDSAIVMLEASTLMLGEIFSEIPLTSAQDSAIARVCRQDPQYDPDIRVSAGTLVDLHVSIEPCFPDSSARHSLV